MMEFFSNEWVQLGIVAACSGGLGAVGMALKSKAVVDLAKFLLQEVAEEAIEKATEKQRKTAKKIQKKS